MADTQRPDGVLTLELCGREFGVKRTFDLIVRIEDVTGQSAMALGTRAANLELPLGDFVKVLHEMVKREDKPPTRQQIGDAVLADGALGLMASVAGFLVQTYVGHRAEAKFKDASEDPT